jgi:hypothetical protein
MTGLATLELQAKCRARARAQIQVGMPAVWATDHRFGLPVTDRGLQRRGARRAASCVLGQQTECYGIDDGETSQESDTFTKSKRPSNNRMKLTSRAFQCGRASQLIRVFARPHQGSEVARVELPYGLSGQVQWDEKKSWGIGPQNRG